MERIIIRNLLIMTVIIGGLYYLFAPNIFYGKSEEQFSQFPIPKSAELTSVTGNTATYQWSGASKEHGIPHNYKRMIGANDWDVVRSEGSKTTFEMDGNKIELNVGDQSFTISKKK